jgi:hypothetical protein
MGLGKAVSAPWTPVTGGHASRHANEYNFMLRNDLKNARSGVMISRRAGFSSYIALVDGNNTEKRRRRGVVHG